MKIANNNDIRDINTSTILEVIINTTSISRADIAKKTKLNKSTVTRITKSLIEKQLVTEIGLDNTEEIKAGRKAILLTPNRNAGFIVSVEISDDYIYGLVSMINGNIIYKDKKQVTTTEIKDYLIKLTNFIDLMILKISNTVYGLVGISVGVHGTVTKKGIIEFAPYLNWRKYDLKSFLENKYSTNIYIENEANLSAIAENSSNPNYKNIITLSMTTGIGVGIMLNNELYRGIDGLAGEIGHMIIVPNGNECPCGNRGCFEQHGSQRAFLNLINSNSKKQVSIQEIYKDKDNEKYHNAIMTVSEIIYIGINNIITMFNPKQIIFNGELITLFPEIIKYIDSKLNTSMTKNHLLVISKLGRDACIIGGLSTIMKNFYNINNILITIK